MRPRTVETGTYAALGLALVLFLAGTLYSLARLSDQREADARVDRLSLWFTTRAEVATARFAVVLERYHHGSPDTSHDDLLEAFDILWSRIPLLSSGESNREYEVQTDLQAEVGQITARLEAIDGDVQDLQPGDEAARRRIVEAIEPIREMLATLTQRIHDTRLGAERDKALQLVRMYRGFLLSLLAMLASGGTLIWRLMREARRARQALGVANEARRVASDLSRDLQAVIDAVPAMITAVDPDGRYVLMNRFHAEFFNIAAARAQGCRPQELGLPEPGPEQPPLVDSPDDAPPFVEQGVTDAAGRGRTLLASRVPVRDDSGAVVRTVHVALDITERKAAEERVRHLALHDPLTDLPNRTFLTESVERALGRAGRRGGLLALHLVDLDRFKEVNDTLGHPIGDALLVEVAARMSGCLRRGDTLARMGGDEFAIVQEDIGTGAEAVAMAQRILESLAAPFRLAGHEVVAGASIGIALGPGDGAEVADLVRHADLALYRAKSDGRNLVRLYEPGMNIQLRARLELEQALRAAVDSEAFELHFQPKQALQGGRLTGVEALVRWRHPDWGLVSPGRFIPVAEDTGLILPMSNWVLGEACRQARRWRGFGRDGLRVAVNLSPELIGRQDVVGTVRMALDVAGLEPSSLELELTESLLVRDADQALKVMTDLRDLGVHLALDDFGTGYSSLAYLQRFPFDTLKIDRGFVAGLNGAGSTSLRIIEAVVRLAHGLGLRVVAEGVETESQLATLERVGCDEMQGYLLSPPVPAAGIDALLAARTPPPARRAATAAQTVDA
ncbi:MAG: EAL domain-containing protein [Geminicoccaceae bacterium]